MVASIGNSKPTTKKLLVLDTDHFSELERDLEPGKRFSQRLNLSVTDIVITVIRITTVKKSASRRRSRRAGFAEELAKMDWEEADLGRRRKGDDGKVRIARRLRRETTVSTRWIANQLSMGTVSNVTFCLKRGRKR